MDRSEQIEGEKRVRAVLIEGLERLGLTRPSRLTLAQYRAMTDEICAKLAYMSEANLQALAEIAAARPGGKDRSQMPIGAQLLDWAATLQEPGTGASPLTRAVFAHETGRRAVAEGWAPELLAEVRRQRLFPKGYALARIEAAAGPAQRQARLISERQARGEAIPGPQLAWLSERRAVTAQCRAIAEGLV